MSIPASANPLLLATTAAEAPAAAYQVDRSLRLNDDDSAYLGKTFSTAGNRRAFTFSAWVKRCEIGATQGRLFGGGVTSTDYFELYFPSGDELRLIWYSGGQTFTTTTRTFRDPGAFFHIVLAVDTTLFTASDRVKIYVNGTLQDRTSTNPSQNFETSVSKNVEHNIGRYLTGSGNSYFDGYVAEVNFIDGQTLEPTAFAEYDSNKNWNPKEYSGTYGPRYSGETWSSAAASTHGFDGSTAYNSSATRLYGTSTYHKIVDAATAFTGVTSVIVGTSENVGDIKLDGTVYSTSYTSGVGLTVTNPPSSFSDIEVLGASGGLQIAYVRVSGELLINYGVHANNSFALTFSDNSSNSALGDDTSGNNKDWTVYNIQASSSTVTHWRQASSSDNPSNSVGTVTYRTERALTDPQTSALVWDHQNTNVIGLQNITGVTSLRLRISSRGSGAKVGVNTGAMVTVGAIGGDYNGASDANSAWYTWSNPPSTITSIAAYGGGSGTGNFLSVWAIEVNGSRVVDTSAAGCDSLVDTPTNYDADSGNNGGNYATWNALSSSGVTLSNGNLDATNSNSATKIASSTIVPTAKCYWEVTIETPRTGAIGGIHGVNAQDARPDHSGGAGIYLAGSGSGGGTYVNGTKTAADYSASAGDIIGFAFDPATRGLIITRNGSSVGTLTAPDTDDLQPVSALNQNVGINVNFGQRPFVHTPPTGYKSLCTQNLPDPTIADGSTVFDVKLWTGNGSSRSISGYGFSPDLAWIKSRSDAYVHYWVDTVRGAANRLQSNSSTTELNSPQSLTAFNSDGFNLGNEQAVNEDTDTFVGWAWDAGTSTVSNTDGSITTSVRANQSAGFSIVTGTGSSSAAKTCGHGLNTEPHFIIVKLRVTAGNGHNQDWQVYHKDLGNTKGLQLNSSSSVETTSSLWNNTSPTNSVFSIGASSRYDGNFVAYCFAPVEGYSAVGTALGTGNANGGFAYTGFRPRFLIWKNADATGNWGIIDSERGHPEDIAKELLFANLSNKEITFREFDFLSNGIKLRYSYTSGHRLVFMAFAENPFKTSRAV